MYYKLESTPVFDKWLKGIKANSTRNRVLSRLDRVSNGNLGDFRSLGSELFELRFFFGSELRVYYTIRDERIALLLSGGDKSSQVEDIQKARRLLTENR